MTEINAKVFKKFLQLGGKLLHGSWVVIGGSLNHLIDKNARVTLDIDLAGPSTQSQKDSFKLMEIAESLGLPVEAINQAGAYFLRQIKNWERDLILIHKGPNASFSRPNSTLCVLLKLKRLSETDLHDCLLFIDFAKKQKEDIDRARIMKQIKQEIKTAISKERLGRLHTLKKYLG